MKNNIYKPVAFSLSNGNVYIVAMVSKSTINFKLKAYLKKKKQLHTPRHGAQSW